MEQYDVIDQFHQHNIGAIINLQQAGEHRDCGDGIINNEFSYSPDDFMRANIFYYNFGWKDMKVPPMELVLNIVQVMCFTLSQNKKIAIHCHAGLGRTGLVIGCYLVYTNQLSAEDAIMQVRTHRPLSIQTTKQANFIHAFAEFTRSIRLVYDDEAAPSSLSQVLARQRKYLHGPEGLALRHVPKIIHITCQRLSEWCVTNEGEEDLARDLTEEEKGQLVKYKSEVDGGKWDGVAVGDGIVVMRMLLDWLCQLSPRLLHEGAEAILGGKSPLAILPLLSESVRKSLAILTTTLRKAMLSVTNPKPSGSVQTLYLTFAKALLPISDGDDDPQLLDAIVFLQDVNP